MPESEQSPETPQATREQALAAFKQFVEAGVTNPDDLVLDDPAVMAANKVLDSWSDLAKRRADQSPAPGSNLEYALSRSTFYVDAGFTDPDYLDEVANDWLAQDLQTAEDQGITEVASKIQAKIDEINARRVG